MTDRAAILLLGLLLAHYLGDFSDLASDRVQEAKAHGGPIGLIAAHAAVHGVLIGLVGLVVVGPAWSLLALAVGIEFVTHFVIDVGRARLGARVPAIQDVERRAFWYALGADQLAHKAVLVGLTVLLV